MTASAVIEETSNPSFVKLENVYFNGTTTNAVVLSEANNVRKLILWDTLSVTDKQILEEFVLLHGGVAPATGTASAGRLVLNYNGIPSSIATGLNAGTLATSGVQHVYVDGLGSSTSTKYANDTTEYKATFTIDSVAHEVTVVGSAAQTGDALTTAIRTQLDSVAVVTLTADYLEVRSKSSGAISTVSVVDQDMFSTIGTTTIEPAVPGKAATPAVTYTATFTFDTPSIIKPVAVSGADARTFDQLVQLLNTAVNGAGTVTFVDGNLIVTSATTGSKSNVGLTDSTLFRALPTATPSSVQGTDGAPDLWELFQTTRSPNGALYAEVFRTLLVGKKPVILPHVPHTIQFTYYDGTQWLYMDDDTPVCAA